MNPLFNAPMVVGYRMANLAMLGVDPSPRRMGEAMRMSSEKSLALWSGLVGMHLAAIKGGVTFWSDAMMGRAVLQGIGGTLDRMHKAGAAPANKTLRENARRLSRRKSI